MANQPTATKFTRAQQSWADHLLEGIREQIKNIETGLKTDGTLLDEENIPAELLDLYDDEMFYTRYSQEMEEQREYIRKTYLGGE